MGGIDPVKDRARRNQHYEGQQAQRDAAGQGDGNTQDAASDAYFDAEYARKQDEQAARDEQERGGNKAPPPPPPLTPEQAAQSEQDKMDQEIRDFVRSRIGAAGKVDTTEEEALITRQMEGKLGEGLVDARARGGRAGFGMSGAQQAVEGDVRGAASRSALDQILGLRRGEEQRAIENATSAIGTEQGMRSAASADALRRMVLESLQAEKGLEGGDAPIPGDTDGNGIISPEERTAAQGANQAERDLQERADSGLGAGVPMPGKKNADGSVTNTANGKTYKTSTMDQALAGNWVYGGASFTADGKTYKVYTDDKGNKHAVEQ
jgi:hypothetical protein